MADSGEEHSSHVSQEKEVARGLTVSVPRDDSDRPKAGHTSKGKQSKTGTTSKDSESADGANQAMNTVHEDKAGYTSVHKQTGATGGHSRHRETSDEEDDYDENDDEEQSDDEQYDEPAKSERFDRFSPSQQRVKRRTARKDRKIKLVSRKRKREPSDSETESSDTDSDSSSDYTGYRPRSEEERRKWKLPKHLARYAREHFTEYRTEDVLRDLMKKNPRPDHRFLKVEQLDGAIENGLPAKVGKTRASHVIRLDETLRRAQEKVLRITGPLMTLFKELDSVRKSKKEKRFNLEEVMELVEKAVVLTGQANVGVRYARRLEVASALTGNRREAKDMLVKYEDTLVATTDLFGPRFNKKIDKEKGSSSNKGLVSLAKGFDQGKKKPFSGGQTYRGKSKQPFQSRSSRGRGARGGPNSNSSSGRGRGRGTGRGQEPASRYVSSCFSINEKVKSVERKHTGSVVFVPKGAFTSRTDQPQSVPSDRGRRHACRTSSARGRKLGENYARPRGLAHGSGLPDPFPRHASSESRRVSTEVLGGRDDPSARGSVEVDGEGGNSPGGISPGSVCGTSVFEAEERRLAAADLQSQAIERLGGLHALQDGRVADAERTDSIGRLAAKIGSQRCVFLRSNLGRAQEVPAVLVGEAAVRVPVPTLRVGVSPTPVHQDPETSDQFVAKAGDQIDHLSRRYSDHESESAVHPPGWQDSSGVVRGAGVCTEQEEVSRGAQPEDGVPRCSGGLTGDDFQSAGGQDSQYLPEMLRDVENGGGVSATVVKVDRGPGLFCFSSAPRAVALQTAPDGAGSCIDEGPVVREHGYALGRRQERDTWWMEMLQQTNGKAIISPGPDLVIETDASRQGWGAAMGAVTVRGHWTAVEQEEHINVLELRAVLFAVQALCSTKSNMHLHIKADNITAVAHINKMGGTRSEGCVRVTTELWEFCLQRQLLLSAEYLPGVENVRADALSRTRPDSSDWMLDKELFSHLNKVWGPFTVDLFASRTNAQLLKYVSWRLDPQAWAVDALLCNWSQERGYAFPPFCMISRCLAKVQRERADLVLIAPVWPAQPWYSALLHLLSDLPILLPQWPDMLTSAVGSQHPLLLTNSLSLAAWRLSGSDSVREAFLRMQPTSSPSPGDQVRDQLIAVPGRGGLAGVVNNRRILFRPLWL